MNEEHEAAPGEETPMASLSEKAVTLWRLTGLGRALMFSGATLAAELVFGTPLPTGALSGTVAAVAIGIALAVPPLRFRAWGFALRERDLYLRHGVLFRTTSIVPHARIQHVDTRHGPVDRWLGLATIVVYTAGTRGAILTIPALDAPRAEEIRDRLAAQSGVGDAV